MKRLYAGVAVALGLLLPLPATPQDPPTMSERLCIWTDSTGQRQAEAEFLSFAAEKVRLRRTDGVEIAVSIARLSQQDQGFLRRNSLGYGATAETWKVLFAGTGDGLQGEYFTDRSFDKLGIVRTDPVIDFKYGRHQNPYTGGREVKPRDGWYENFSVRWTGLVVPRYSETYTFSVVADDGFHLWIDDRMIASNWQWKGNVPYTGQVKLTAGRPATIKLLFYQGPFGGLVNLSWSSPSQEKQIIPQSQLYLPINEEDEELPGAAPPTTLAGHVTTKSIPLSAPVSYAPRGGWGTRPPLVLAPLVDGGYKIGWNDRGGTAHLTTVDPGLKPMQRDVLLPKFDLRDMVVHDDGGVGILGAELPYRMWLRRLDPRGQQTSFTVLSGEQGKVLKAKYLDNLWCFSGRLATSGTQYAAHFGQVWQTDPNVAHQGGYFGIVDMTGKKLIDNQWTVSHSFDQQVIYHCGSFITLSHADPFPKGLWLENRTLGFGRLVFPTEAEIKTWKYDQARLGSLFSVGRNVGLVFLSHLGESREIFYILARDDGHVLRTVQLTVTPQIDEQAVKAALFGGHILVVWREGKSDTKAGIIDLTGKWLTTPELLGQPIPQNHELTRLPHGDVAWLVTQDGARDLKLVQVTQAAGEQVEVVERPSAKVQPSKTAPPPGAVERRDAASVAGQPE